MLKSKYHSLAFLFFYSWFCFGDSPKIINTLCDIEESVPIERFILSKSRQISDICEGSCEDLRVTYSKREEGSCELLNFPGCEKQLSRFFEVSSSLPAKISMDIDSANNLNESCIPRRSVYWVSPLVLGFDPDLGFFDGLDHITVFILYQNINDQCVVEVELYL